MNYRDISPRGPVEPQRERQRPDPAKRHEAFVRQRGGTETTVSEADRERAKLWHRDEWEAMQRARKAFVVEMLDKYGGHRASKLLGYAVQTLYAIRATVQRDACPRRYPLDPLTAEDPCEDCGADQRKHDIGGDP